MGSRFLFGLITFLFGIPLSVQLTGWLADFQFQGSYLLLQLFDHPPSTPSSRSSSARPIPSPPLTRFIEEPGKKTVILRHDVDRLPGNSLTTARMEHESGISGSYYFRVVPESYDEAIIRQISQLGHEIGYHYEDLTLAGGDVDKAYGSFCRHLEKLRNLVPVTTICMHGSPSTFYLTDTGRRWDGNKVSVRDKAMASNPVTNPDFLHRSYHATSDIIKALETGSFPGCVMLTLHPQRWTDNKLRWVQELIAQNLKNQVKRVLVK